MAAQMTERQLLAREVTTAHAALPAALWPLLLPAAALVLAGEWQGRSRDDKPACEDCGRLQAYGHHPCSCPTGQVGKRLGSLLAAEAA